MRRSSNKTTKVVVGCFQFFYSSADPDLPNLDVPTRDVSDTRKAGNKTERFMERRLENWCACRAPLIELSFFEDFSRTRSITSVSGVITNFNPTRFWSVSGVIPRQFVNESPIDAIVGSQIRVTQRKVGTPTIRAITVLSRRVRIE